MVVYICHAIVLIINIANGVLSPNGEGVTAFLLRLLDFGLLRSSREASGEPRLLI